MRRISYGKRRYLKGASAVLAYGMCRLAVILR